MQYSRDIRVVNPRLYNDRADNVHHDDSVAADGCGGLNDRLATAPEREVFMVALVAIDINITLVRVSKSSQDTKHYTPSPESAFKNARQTSAWLATVLIFWKVIITWRGRRTAYCAMVEFECRSQGVQGGAGASWGCEWNHEAGVP